VHRRLSTGHARGGPAPGIEKDAAAGTAQALLGGSRRRRRRGREEGGGLGHPRVPEGVFLLLKTDTVEPFYCFFFLHLRYHFLILRDVSWSHALQSRIPLETQGSILANS
jgi:hypothetical protein